MARVCGARRARSASTCAAVGKRPANGDCPSRNGANDKEANRTGADAAAGVAPGASPRFGHHQIGAAAPATTNSTGKSRAGTGDTRGGGGGGARHGAGA